VINSIVMPFGNYTLYVTIVAQVRQEFESRMISFLLFVTIIKHLS
jgi:hypothetical protein